MFFPLTFPSEGMLKNMMPEMINGPSHFQPRVAHGWLIPIPLYSLSFGLSNLCISRQTYLYIPAISLLGLHLHGLSAPTSFILIQRIQSLLNFSPKSPFLILFLVLFSLPLSSQADISEREFKVLFLLPLLTVPHLHFFPGQAEALLPEARARSCGTTARRRSRAGLGTFW